MGQGKPVVSPVDGVNDGRNLSQANHVLQPQVLDVGLPDADELAQQAHTGLQQLGVCLHGQSQRHCLKDDGVLGVVLVDVLGNLVACSGNHRDCPCLM